MKRAKTVIFSITGALLSATAYLLWVTRKKKETQTVFGTDKSKEEATVSSSSTSAPELYKTAGVKKLELKNIPESLTFSDSSYDFTGMARVHPNEHDKYNVDVLDNNGSFLGNIVKNRRLSHSLSEWHAGEVFAFGKIKTTNNESALSGIVYIPAGLNNSQIEDLKNVFEKLNTRHRILSKPDVSSEEYLQILDDHKFISRVLVQLDIVDEIDASLSKKIIPALSRQLEDEQNFEGLLKLEKHSDLIDALSERFAAATYKRISKAREKLS